MKSRTSFFNGTVLKKDITRFAPVWGLYTILLLFLLWTNANVSNWRSDTTQLNLAHNLISTGNGTPFLMAFVCSTLLFGDLFKSRMCNAMHAMPLRRETWFFTHVLSGVLFFVVPTTLVALLMMPIMKEQAYFAALWWLIQVGSFLVFFALANCCSMCVGNRIGHAIFFLILTFLPIIIYGIYSTIYEPLLKGVTSDSLGTELLSPGAALFNVNAFFKWVYGDIAYVYRGIDPNYWIALGCWVAVGIGLYYVALLLYKRRKLEWAGDFVNYTVLRWLLLVLGSFLLALLLHIPGFLIGFFALSMLLERTVKVFHKSNWIRFAIFAVVVALTIGMTYLDIFGIVSRIPALEKIESVGIGYETSDTYQLLYDTEDIQMAMELHEQAIGEEAIPENSAYSYRLTYHLKNGQEMRRYYNVSTESEPFDNFRKYMSSFEVVFGTDDPDALRRSIYSIQVNLNDEKQGITPLYQWEQIPSEQFDSIWNAILADCENGFMAQRSDLHQHAYWKNADTIRIWYYGEAGSGDITLNIYSDSQTYRLLG